MYQVNVEACILALTPGYRLLQLMPKETCVYSHTFSVTYGTFNTVIMENSPQNPVRLTAISFDAPDILKISKPHDHIPKSEHYYLWGENRLHTSIKLNGKKTPFTKKVAPATYDDPAAIEKATEGKSIFLYYVDDWDAQNDSVSFYAM